MRISLAGDSRRQVVCWVRRGDRSGGTARGQQSHEQRQNRPRPASLASHCPIVEGGRIGAVMSPGRVSLTPAGCPVDSADVNRAEIGQKERRVERVYMETDRQRIVGDITLPPEGYQSRFSDSLNRVDIMFIPLVNAEISSIMGGDVEKLPFMVVSKSHVRVAFPIEAAQQPRA